jgi:hypothetical protein
MSSGPRQAIDQTDPNRACMWRGQVLVVRGEKGLHPETLREFSRCWGELHPYEIGGSEAAITCLDHAWPGPWDVRGGPR